MSLTVATVINFIPTHLWRSLKKFVTKDQTVVFDLPFKISTKYTPALLFIMMCLSFANQFVRDIDIDCSTNGSGGQGNSRSEYSSGDNMLNDFCWNYDTFLVVKALDPNMRGMVTYPGVSGYNAGVDEVIELSYYKYVWFILGQLIIIAFSPYFFWKVRATKKIKPLVNITESEDHSEDEQRRTMYLETIGFNESFARFYLGCKILGTLTPFAQWYYLCGFLGGRYKLYGFDVLANFLDDTVPWPNPMDALFPKMAKCEWNRNGFGGDIEKKSAQCQLPMNNITQWSFFVFWWWIAMVAFVNVLSLCYLFFNLFSPCRHHQYRKFVTAACREDVEKLRCHTVHFTNGTTITKKHNKNQIVHIHLSFGDWLVLSFIKKNLEDWKFRDFIRKLANTENRVIQIKQVPILLTTFDTRNEINGKQRDEKWEIDIDKPDQVEGHLAANMEIGFNKSLLNRNLINRLPGYPERETEGEQYFFDIKTPAKIDRHKIHNQNKNVETENRQDRAKNSTDHSAGRSSNYGWVPPAVSKKTPYDAPTEDQFEIGDWNE